MMNIILWNILGIASLASFNRLCSFIRNYRPPSWLLLSRYSDTQLLLYNQRLGFDYILCCLS